MELWGAQLFGDPCRDCGFDWSITAPLALAFIEQMPLRARPSPCNAPATSGLPPPPGVFRGTCATLPTTFGFWPSGCRERCDPTTARSRATTRMTSPRREGTSRFRFRRRFGRWRSVASMGRNVEVRFESTGRAAALISRSTASRGHWPEQRSRRKSPSLGYRRGVERLNPSLGEHFTCEPAERV